MTENGLLAEAQALRALIKEYHGREKWLYLATWDADAPALRKFQAYCSRIFGDAQRQERLLALGILIGRPLDSTVPGLTIGEVFAFLTWLDDGPAFRIRPGARRLLVALRDHRDFRIKMRATLGKIKQRRIDAPPEQEDDAAWLPTPAHQNQTVPF